jgi:predicted site-specific integrase-resolvase
MANFLRIGSYVLVALLMVLTAEGRLCTAFLENHSETSSENHRDCSSDEFAARVSATARSEIANQLRLSKRHPGNQVQGSVASITSALNKSTMYKESLSFARNNALTTVLRI